MDPVACIRRCLDLYNDYLENGDHEKRNEVIFSLTELSVWMVKGGDATGNVEYGGVTRSFDEWFHLITDSL